MDSDASGPETEPLGDEVLLEAYRRGDEQAAEVLFHRYYARLVGLARRQMGGILCPLEDSADVVQSVFRSVFERGRSDRIQFTAQNSLWPLLATITINKVRNRIKYHTRQRRDRRREVPLEDRDPLETGPTAEDATRLQELIQELRSPVRPAAPGRDRRTAQRPVCYRSGTADRPGRTHRLQNPPSRPRNPPADAGGRVNLASKCPRAGNIVWAMQENTNVKARNPK